MLRFSFWRRQTTKIKTSKSLIKRLWKCPYCEKLVSNASILFHALVHSLEKPFQCFECRERFEDEDNFDNHIREHEMARITQKREMSEQQRKSLKKKANITRDTKLTLADANPEIFVQITTTRSGRIVRQKVNAPTTVMFPRKSGVRIHSKKSTKKFPLKKLKSFKQSLTDEVLTDGLIHCGYCPKTFHRLSNLKVHMKNHHRPQKATSIVKSSKSEETQERRCFVDGKKLVLPTSEAWKPTSQIKAKNLKSKNGQKGHSMKVQKPSTKVLARANNQHHKALDATNPSSKLAKRPKELPALLSLCDRRQHEPNQCNLLLLENPASILGFQCQRCPARFLNFYDYHAHVAGHDGYPNFCCHFCEKSFITQSHLDAHLKAFHSVTADLLDRCLR